MFLVNMQIDIMPVFSYNSIKGDDKNEKSGIN